MNSSSISPFAARTQQYFKEQIGTADDKVCDIVLRILHGRLADRDVQTELPPDYIELEKRVDALKQVHQKLLSVTHDAPVHQH